MYLFRPSSSQHGAMKMVKNSSGGSGQCRVASKSLGVMDGGREKALLEGGLVKSPEERSGDGALTPSSAHVFPFLSLHAQIFIFI